jgi:hypothetical protein
MQLKTISSDAELMIVVDETAVPAPRPFAGVGLAVLSNPIVVATKLTELARELCGDPYFSSIPTVNSSLAKVGFHYSADTPDVRLKMLTFMQTVSFEAYVAFFDGRATDARYEWYDEIIAALLPDRLLKHADQPVRIVFEQHGDIPQRRTQLGSLVQEITARLSRRRPLDVAPTVEMASKEQPCLAIADYVIGAFRDYWLTGQTDAGSLSARHFGELRSRIRLAIDMRNSTRYTRTNPLP